MRPEAAAQYATKRSSANAVTWVDIANAASVDAPANATAFDALSPDGGKPQPAVVPPNSACRFGLRR
jgi:hypothetical protein